MIYDALVLLATVYAVGYVTTFVGFVAVFVREGFWDALPEDQPPNPLPPEVDLSLPPASSPC